MEDRSKEKANTKAMEGAEKKRKINEYPRRRNKKGCYGKIMLRIRKVLELRNTRTEFLKYVQQKKQKINLQNRLKSRRDKQLERKDNYRIDRNPTEIKRKGEKNQNTVHLFNVPMKCQKMKRNCCKKDTHHHKLQNGKNKWK